MSAALAAVGALCLVNLALLFAAIRKLRLLDERVGKMPLMAPAALLPVGSRVPEFAAVTTAGESRSVADLAGSRSVVGFFSPNCQPCKIQVPQFIEFARALPGGAGHALAVVVGDGAAAAELAAELDGAATVVLTAARGPLIAAFSVRGFPAFYLVDPAGRIEAHGMGMQALVSPVPA